MILRHRSLSELAADVAAHLAVQTDGLAVVQLAATEFRQVVEAIEAQTTSPAVLILPTGGDYDGRGSWKYRDDRVNVIVVGEWRADVAGSDDAVWDLMDTIARRFLPDGDDDPHAVEVNGVLYAPISLKPVAVAQDRTCLALLLQAANPMQDQGDAEIPPGSPLPTPASRFPNQYSTDGESWADDYTAGHIYLRWSTDGGDTYGPALRFAGDPGAAPRFQYSADGESWADDPAEDTVYLRISTDEGDTWSAAIRIRGAGSAHQLDAPDDGPEGVVSVDADGRVVVAGYSPAAAGAANAAMRINPASAASGSDLLAVGADGVNAMRVEPEAVEYGDDAVCGYARLYRDGHNGVLELGRQGVNRAGQLRAGNTNIELRNLHTYGSITLVAGTNSYWGVSVPNGWFTLGGNSPAYRASILQADVNYNRTGRDGQPLEIIGGNARPEADRQGGYVSIKGGVSGGTAAGADVILHGSDHGPDGTAEGAVRVTNADGTTKIIEALESKIGFFGGDPVAQQKKADHNDWASLSDVVAALVALGLFDEA